MVTNIDLFNQIAKTVNTAPVSKQKEVYNQIKNLVNNSSKKPAVTKNIIPTSSPIVSVNKDGIIAVSPFVDVKTATELLTLPNTFGYNNVVNTPSAFASFNNPASFNQVAENTLEDLNKGIVNIGKTVVEDAKQILSPVDNTLTKYAIFALLGLGLITIIKLK